MGRAKMRVLLVEDNVNMRRTLKHMLQKIGFNFIFEAEDGDIALQKLAVQPVDLVISDWNMPRVKGIEVLKAMRRVDKFKDIPFLMVTAEIQEDIIAQAGERDVDGYIIKPFTWETLSHKIDQILRRRENPSEIDTLMRLGQTYRQSGKKKEAIEAFVKVLAHKSDYGPAVIPLAEMAIEDGDLDKAQKLLTQILERHPKYLRALDTLADVYSQKGEDARRLELLETATAISPLDSARQVNLAESRSKNGDSEGAKQAFSKAVELDPEAEKESSKIAEGLLASGQYEAAIDLFEKTLERDPMTLETYNRMGIAYRRQDKHEEAIKLYDRALTVAPGNSTVIYNKGCAYLEWRKIKGAKEMFELALQNDPTFKEAREALELIEGAKATVAN